MPASSYNPAYFGPLLAIEDLHFWFRARNQVITLLARQLEANLAPGYKVLEVGCGTGNVLRQLKQVCSRGKVFGMDLFVEGLRCAQQRTDALLVQGDMHTPPFGTQFELIGLFDVLEHLPDDVRVLSALHTMLSSSGILFLTVPAHASLWSYFDDASHHVRRYAAEELKEKLLATGYQIEYVTQYMAVLFPLIWLGRRIAGLVFHRGQDEPQRAHELSISELRIVPIVNEMLTLLLTQEARFLTRRRQLPGGASLLVIARKKSNPASNI